jgi:hypothetical protein
MVFRPHDGNDSRQCHQHGRFLFRGLRETDTSLFPRGRAAGGWLGGGQRGHLGLQRRNGHGVLCGGHGGLGHHLRGLATAAFVPFAYTYITNIDNTITITGCTGAGGDVTIPDTIDGLSVTGIGAGAFQHNSSLTNITIPASVISLGSLAFSDCTNLTEIHFLGNAPTADLTVFSGDNHAIVYYPPGIPPAGVRPLTVCWRGSRTRRPRPGISSYDHH